MDVIQLYDKRKKLQSQYYYMIMKMKLLQKKTGKVASQVLKKLYEVADLNNFMGAKNEKELQVKSTLSSFKQRTKTIEYYFDDIHEVYKTLAKDMDEDTRIVKILYRNFEINKTFHIESDEFGCFLEAYVHENDFRQYFASCYSPEELIRCIQRYRPVINLSEEKIDKIIGLGNECCYNGEINMDEEQSLIVMLQIAHLFKLHMDYQRQWYKIHEDRLNREIEQFKAEQGIRDFLDEDEWKQKHGELQYHFCIPKLLLQTIYSLNGSHFNINVWHQDYEEVFDTIFVDMPLGRDFDIAILKFLLLPLYNSNHKTNYRIKD
jgi:hypothetical protein